MSGLGEGQPHANRSISNPMYLSTGDPGPSGGNTYSGGNSNEVTMQQYENIFGPAARDIKEDSQRHKRHQRWHLPDALKGSNQYLTDRVDGLITDSTNSPFTRNILPYVYLENPDQKLKWNVYSFDEGISSRVPYEAAARVLPQSKRSFAGFTVRQGLAIAMEHNFLASAAGRENFKNQLTQLVGSIQMTNDLDVHIALLQAPSYQKQMNEKYYDQQRTTAQVCRQYVDLFGIMQKVPNALDILIEDAKNHLQTWGSQPPTFLLCNGALTAQLTMLPEKTNYVTNGVDGAKRLAQGPELSSYRGLSIIHSRKFSMDTGTTPRDLLRRRVRVAEYYRIPWTPQNSSRTYEFYDQSRDTMFRLTWDQLCQMAHLPGGGVGGADEDYPGHPGQYWTIMSGTEEPEGFQWNSWDGTNHPAPIRLVLNNVPAVMAGGAVVAPRHQTIEGFESLLQAMGLGAGAMHRPSSLIWPRTVYPTDGDKRKKRTIDQISKDVPVQNAVSTQFISKQMNEMQRNHHRQSETFGAGIYNDPILAESDPELRILNWNGLAYRQHQEDVTLISGLTLNAFNQLHSELNLGVLEEELRNGLVRPTDWELNNAGFLNEANVRTSVAANLDSAALEAHYVNPYGAFNTTHVGGVPNGAAIGRAGHPIGSAAFRFGDIRDAINNQTLLSDRLTVLDYNVAPPVVPAVNFWEDHVCISAAYAMYNYICILTEWRKLCYGDLIEHMVSTRATSMRPHGNCGGHTHFDKFKKGLITACLSQTSPTPTVCVDDEDPNRHYDAVFARNCLRGAGGGFEIHLNQVKNDLKQNTEFTKMTMNVVNSILGSNNVINQPNLHINRCHPLDAPQEKLDATSINPTSWLLQHIASMMPLTKDMADPLMKTAGTLQDQYDVLQPQYAAFLNGIRPGGAGGVGGGGGGGGGGGAGGGAAAPTEWDTFLMHWFMSEFHPSLWVREAAKQKCGMNNNEFHRIQRLMDAMANALERNETFTPELESACADLAPGRFDGRDVSLYYCLNSSAKTYDCVRKWNKDKNLHVSHKPWYETPVSLKKEMRMQSDVQTSSVFPRINALPENLTKAIVKASAKYHRENLINVLENLYGAGAPTVDQNNQKYFDVSTNSVHDVHAGDDLVNLSHPWTNFIPGGIEALSSTTFPIDWQYRADQTNPESAGQKVYSDNNLRGAAHAAAESCRSSPREAMREVLMILFTRFFKPAARFMNDGAGVALAPKTFGNARWNYSGYAFAGCHLKHGPFLVETSNSGGVGGGGAQDIVILRPNIEHEMLGIIMGRGGTQELGATFWGQTELSCYDDAQHGIWGMSYKYHERAIVTNERNMIRVFDVAFDGYNGGMDQSNVDWGSPSSTQAFMQNTFNRSQAYHGDSMLVMAFPHHEQTSKKSWPNPIMFQPKDSGNSNPDPEKSAPPANTKEHVVFNNDINPVYCTKDQQSKYDEYMQALGMSYWTTPDISNRPAGDCCIGNETSAHMMAFEGTMKVYNANGAIVSETQGSGHLGPSYVGVASVREGRGILNPSGAPSLGRLI